MPDTDSGSEEGFNSLVMPETDSELSGDEIPSRPRPPTSPNTGLSSLVMPETDSDYSEGGDSADCTIAKDVVADTQMGNVQFRQW